MYYRSRLLLVISAICLGFAPDLMANLLLFNPTEKHSSVLQSTETRWLGTTDRNVRTSGLLSVKHSQILLTTASTEVQPSSDRSASVKRWMGWAAITVIPTGVVAGILYGLRRSTQKQPDSKSGNHLSGDDPPEQNEPNHAVVQESLVNNSQQHRNHQSNHQNNGYGHSDPLNSPQVTKALSEEAVSMTPPGSAVEEAKAPAISQTTRLARVDIVEQLISDLHNPDSGKRRKAIWDLGQQGDSRAIQPLVDLLIDSDSQQRSLILATLSEIGVRTLKPLNRALMLSIQDESPDVRKNAIRDLTRIYDLMAQISQLLQYATSDGDGEVRDTAQWALTQLNRMRQLPDGLTNADNSESRESLPGDSPNSHNSKKL